MPSAQHIATLEQENVASAQRIAIVEIEKEVLSTHHITVVGNEQTPITPVSDVQSVNNQVVVEEGLENPFLVAGNAIVMFIGVMCDAIPSGMITWAPQIEVTTPPSSEHSPSQNKVRYYTYGRQREVNA